MIWRTMSRSLLALTFTLVCWAAGAQGIDWNKVQDEAIGTLQEYIRINTSNPPGDTREAADFLTRILEREGLTVTRYTSAPGKVIIHTRLKGAG